MPAPAVQAFFTAADAPMLVSLTISADAGSVINSYWSDAVPMPVLEWGFPVTSRLDVVSLPSSATTSSVLLSIPHSFAVVPATSTTDAGCPDITYEVSFHSEGDHSGDEFHGSTCGAFVTANDTTTIAGIVPSTPLLGRCKQTIAEAFGATSGDFVFEVRGLEAGTAYHFDVRARNELTGLELPYHPTEASTLPAPQQQGALSVAEVAAIVAAAGVVAAVIAMVGTRYACPRVVTEYVRVTGDGPDVELASVSASSPTAVTKVAA